ncbi:MAG TPA: CDP-diacylglycerol O-phosphatidyltransferase, partial [Sphingomicrobium sp.]|nr:CDP-diacylglycerol O-phosphatidyltransferase [Sphingomicrobium sp.]
LPTYSWSSIRVRREWRLYALAGVAVLGAALLTAPWATLSILALLYLLMIPLALASYSRVKRRRASAAAPA